MNYSSQRKDQRKHRVQMSQQEIERITDLVRKVKTWTGLDAPYINKRKYQWQVTNADILAALGCGELIEVHNNNAPDVRFVVRYTLGVRSVCVCASITQFRVITVWINDAEDNHSTLRLKEYKWDVDLLSLPITLPGRTDFQVEKAS